ncbi:nicotinate phosphoribosyltransferase, partial [Lactobacillus sp. CRM56-2]|nr:nicotinate phosphoribosyltransferase [Lactobacillus sp. CRM56-2]
KMPFHNGYAVFAGLERVVNYINHLHFTATDIAYLRELGGYSDGFLDFLANFIFVARIRAVRVGDLVFNNEALLQVVGPLATCVFIETALLNIIYYQTLIASKAARFKSVVGVDGLLE